MQPLLQKVSVLLTCLSTSVGVAQSFADLPTGTYRYTQSDSERLMRKSGSVVIGIEILDNGSRSSLVRSCFRGQAAGDRLIHVTQVSPPYDPASHWESNLTIEITSPLAGNTVLTEAEQAALETCIQAFWR